MSEGTWAEIWLVTSAEGPRVKAQGNIDIVKLSAEGRNVKALESVQIQENIMLKHFYVISIENLY